MDRDLCSKLDDIPQYILQPPEYYTTAVPLNLKQSITCFPAASQAYPHLLHGSGHWDLEDSKTHVSRKLDLIPAASVSSAFL